MSLALKVVASALTRPPRRAYGPGPSQVADVHLPSGPGPHPVVVLLHGGYWRTQYGRLTTRPLARELAAAGVAAVNLEYRRVGTGRAGGGGWPQTFEDVAAGLDALTGVPGLDLERVDVVGHSAGGQLALWAAARERLPAGAPGSGPRVHVHRVVALAPVTQLRRTGDAARQLMGSGPDDEPERWAQADPSATAPLERPVLVVHPTGDDTIPVARSVEWASTRPGVRLVTPVGEGHRDVIDPSSASWAVAREWLLRR